MHRRYLALAGVPVHHFCEHLLLLQFQLISLLLSSLLNATLHLQLFGQGTMKVDESTLTGESMAVSKKSGATILAGAVVAEGEMDAVVSAIGKECFFGKTMALLDAPQEVGHLHQVRAWLLWLLSLPRVHTCWFDCIRL